MKLGKVSKGCYPLSTCLMICLPFYLQLSWREGTMAVCVTMVSDSPFILLRGGSSTILRKFVMLDIKLLSDFQHSECLATVWKIYLWSLIVESIGESKSSVYSPENMNSTRRYYYWSIFIPLVLEVGFPNHCGNVVTGIDSSDVFWFDLKFVFHGIWRLQLFLFNVMFLYVISTNIQAEVFVYVERGEKVISWFLENNNDPKNDGRC